MYCLNLLLLQLKNYSEGEKKNRRTGINNQKQPWRGVLNND